MLNAFTGLPAEAFWELSEHIKAPLPADEEQRLGRADRQRALGGGRDVDQPLVIRVAVVLTSRRWHIPQEAVAQLHGATPAAVSREWRRLLPVIQQALPSPAVWERIAAGDDVPPEQGLEREPLRAGQARLAATEPRGSRPTDREPRQAPDAGQQQRHAQHPTRA